MSPGARKLSYNFRDIAFSRYDDYWKELRKLCVQELFSTKQVNLIQPIKKMEMKKLIHSITESAYKKTPVNLSETFLSLNVNVVCKASFGVSFQGTVLNNEKFQGLIHEAIEMLGSFSASDFFPYIGWIFDWFTGLHARRERSVRDLDAFYEQMIDLHLQKNREERSEDDFVDLLLKLEKEEAVLGYGKLTRNHIKAILMVSIISHKKIKDEVRESFSNKQIVSCIYYRYFLTYLVEVFRIIDLISVNMV